jgi:mannitol/fructose-specific phosphotransferase system IIA component (Ntr-type)
MHQHRNHDADIQISFVVPNKQTQQSGFLQEMSSFQQDNDNLQQLWAEDTITTKQFDETLHSVEQLAQHTVHDLLKFCSVYIFHFYRF